MPAFDRQSDEFYLGPKTSDGRVIGDSITDKVAFYGGTPIARRASANQAVATDLASVVVLANELRAALMALNLIKGAA